MFKNRVTEQHASISKGKSQHKKKTFEQFGSDKNSKKLSKDKRVEYLVAGNFRNIATVAFVMSSKYMCFLIKGVTTFDKCIK